MHVCLTPLPGVFINILHSFEPKFLFGKYANFCHLMIYIRNYSSFIYDAAWFTASYIWAMKKYIKGIPITNALHNLNGSSHFNGKEFKPWKQSCCVHFFDNLYNVFAALFLLKDTVCGHRETIAQHRNMHCIIGYFFSYLWFLCISIVLSHYR